MEEKYTDKTTHRVCDSCRDTNMICSGTLPCDNCISKQSSSSLKIKCTYNQEIKNRSAGYKRLSNKLVYNSIKEKMNKLQSMVSSLDPLLIEKIMKEAIQINENTTKASHLPQKRKTPDQTFVQTKIKQHPIKTKTDSTRILKMGINKNIFSTKRQKNDTTIETLMNMDKFELENVLLCKEGQLEQFQLSYKLFYYLNPTHLKKLISHIKANSVEKYKSSMNASEVFFTLNTLLQKDNEIYSKSMFQSDVDFGFSSKRILKIPTKIMQFIRPKIPESNDFFFIKSQKRVMNLYDIFERLNSDTSDNGYINFGNNMTLSEINVINTILLINITLYKNEKENDTAFFDDLSITELAILKNVIGFYKIFAHVSRESQTIENNIYNIQSLLNFAFYLENSPSPTLAARILSSCISYLQLLHYNDSCYINQLLHNENMDYPESLKFQIRSLYLTCYMYDKTISLRCHKPDLLSNKDEAFTVMNHHTRDLLKFYNFGNFLNKKQNNADDNGYINILDGNTTLYNELINDIDGSDIIIQHLNLRVSYLHSLVYRYLTATKNENDPLEITLQKKQLVLENFHKFKLQVKTLFGFTEFDQTINIVSHIGNITSVGDTLKKIKLAWKYLVTAIDYYTLVMIIHLTDLETLQNVETEKDIARATKYCQNSHLLKAIKDSLETTVYIMEFSGLHKYESSSVLFCALVGISSAFNVCIFNQQFFEDNKDLMVKVIKLVTKTSSKKGFIDTLKWSAISVLGMSIMKILFELNSIDDISKELNFKELFKDDYVQTVEILDQVSKLILHGLDSKRSKESAKQNEIYYNNQIDGFYDVDSNNQNIETVQRQHPHQMNSDALEHFNSSLSNEDMNNLNAEIESFMDKEIMKLLNLENNELGEDNDNRLPHRVIQTVFSKANYSLDGFLDDELFEHGVFFKE
ncbi:uncharacterized protein HGUI_01256 [Hanseniaspora guilliermondii]|uniref:Zn(2)-C6 fungal-type domain-containing protein n=1 Tax=Hanseniaspora guilliermondii TaxID=56406 RepID=A0A1L0AYA5_9ASCO|nr:uncharacterized protein HGUI_01256 [Hanseniaspora guilliermondii]